MTHTSRASPTPAHVHTGQAQCWGGGGQGVKMLSTPANPCLSTALPTAIQPEPAGDLSPVPARPLPPPPYPRVPPGSLHQLGPWLPKPVLCARQGKGAQARPEEACQCWGQEGRAMGTITWALLKNRKALIVLISAWVVGIHMYSEHVDRC